MNKSTKGKQTRRIYSMHTLRGHAAFYAKGGQICYSQKNIPIKLARSVAQIKTEQSLSTGYRNKQGFGDTTADYSFRRVVMP